MSERKHYLTHDNYNRPFCVYIDELNNEVSVYKRDTSCCFLFRQLSTTTDLKNYTKLIKTFNPDKIFIGESPLNKMTEFSGGHGPYFDGNSILLKINTSTYSFFNEKDTFKYVFIGEKIYSFKTKHEIVSFVSPVGNNDVPYPYAIDDKDNYYFLTGTSSTGILRIDDISKRDSPYKYFFFIVKNIGESENIEWMYMGDDRYTMSTSSRPADDYDNFIIRYMIANPITFSQMLLGHQRHMYIQFKGEEKKRISRNEYIQLLENYNKKVGLIPLSDVKIIHKRIW